MNKPAVLVVTGPTCSGKTEVALHAARELNGEIVCCDSRQLFRGMDIGSAQPGSRERREVPHHLYGVLEPKEACSAGAYRALAEPVLRDAISRGRLPILVGGTGLYLGALLGGMGLAPPAGEKGLKAARETMDRLGVRGAWAELKKIDPETAASVHPNDRYRIVRALSIYIDTGRPISDWRKESRSPEFRGIQAALSLERTLLYTRIDERCRLMLRSGMPAEAQRLRDSGYEKRPPVQKAIGYTYLFKVLDGEMKESEALSLMQRDTRRYAKRQMTWLRNQNGLRWIDSSAVPAAADSVIALFRSDAGA